MSFNDDLNKFVHNYPYTNYHELVLDFLTSLVQDLKKIVDEADLEHLPEKFAAINATLDSNQLAISALESASTAASEAIRDLRAITSAHTQDLAAIHEEIDGVIDDLSDAVRSLEDDIGALEDDYNNFKSSTSAELEILSQAAFGNFEIVPMPFTFLMDVRNGNSKGIRIVVDESITANDSIVWIDNKGGQTNSALLEKQKCPNTFTLPMFKSSGNPCHLVIPSIIPYKYNGGVDFNIYFYAQRWTGATAGSNTGISRKDGYVSLSSLLAAGGVQETPTQTNMCLHDVELVVNPNTGDYDLYLYNGRNGHYCAISDYTPTCIMASTVNIRPNDSGYVQRFYNLKNSAYNQIAAGLNPDGKIASALSEAKGYTDTEVGELNAYLQGAISNAVNAMNARITPSELSFTPNTGVSVVRNCSFEEAFTYSAGNNIYNVRKLYIELTVDITNLEHNTDTGIGTFALGSSLTSNHNVNCDIQKPNTGCYAQIAGLDGTVAIHAYNPSGESFGLSSRVHIMGTIIQEIIS